MKICMIPVVYDDEGQECRIGSDVILRTKKIQQMSSARIKDISASYLTLEFDDPLIGFHPINIRISEILEFRLY